MKIKNYFKLCTMSDILNKNKNKKFILSQVIYLFFSFPLSLNIEIKPNYHFNLTFLLTSKHKNWNFQIQNIQFHSLFLRTKHALNIYWIPIYLISLKIIFQNFKFWGSNFFLISQYFIIIMFSMQTFDGVFISYIKITYFIYFKKPKTRCIQKFFTLTGH